MNVDTCSFCGKDTYSPVECHKCHALVCGTTDTNCAAWDDDYIGAVWLMSHFDSQQDRNPGIFVCQYCSGDN